MKAPASREAASGQSDEELFAAFQGGDHVAFNSLFANHNDDLLSFIYLKVRDHHLAEDFAQQAWMNAVKGAKNFRADSAFKTWLFVIANNVVRRELPKSKRLQTNVSDTAGPTEKDIFSSLEEPTTTLQPLLTNEIRTQVREKLKQLEPEKSAILDLFYMQDFTLKDLEEIYHENVNTIKTRLRRARLEYQELIQGHLAA